MAKEGVIMDHFYTMPVCTPSRTTLLTGQYAQQSGLQRGVIEAQEPYGVPTKFKFLSETLKTRAGYATHTIGKWHLGYCSWKYTPLYRGFDTFFGFYNGAEENYYHCRSKYDIYRPVSNCTGFGFDFRLDNKDVHNEFVKDYSAFLYAKRAEEIIQNHPNDKPLFMYIALTDAHFPVQPPKRFRKHCKDEVNEARINFCAAMAASDEAVRNITLALKRKGLYENSVIVYTSDNGGSSNFGGNNYPLRGGKGGLWEGGSRVPGFVHSPLLKKKGYVHDGIFHMVDWYPTFMHLAGLKPDPQLRLQGENQWPSLSEGKKSARTEFPYNVDVINKVVIAAVRKGDYKLIATSGGNPDTVVTEEETTDETFNVEHLQNYIAHFQPFNYSDTSPKLFNLANDPSESHNLADSEPLKLEELRLTLKYYMNIAKPAVKIASDPAGNPENYGNVYTPGWCKPAYDVPETLGNSFMDLDKGDLN